MASADEIFPAGDCCEICGAVLGDEVVIQEFADGSLARLCPECAAGANLGGGEARRKQEPPRDSIWPDDRGFASTGPAPDLDPLEKTRELLMPVADLITLQGEMQSALERLAASLERFAAEMITDSQDKTAVENRLEMLERELDKTRTQLSETEFLPSTAAPDSAPPAALEEASAPVVSRLVAPPAPMPEVPQAPVTSSAKRAGKKSAVPSAESVPAIVPTAAAVDAAEHAASTPPAQGHQGHMPTFRIEEVQAAQRFYNESPFIGRIRDVRRSLGKPKANLTRLPGAEPRAIVTVAWDIVWYQYLVDLRRDLPGSADRVTLHREGMDVDELAFHFRDKNAVINDDGRLDASELEVQLLSDPSALITEMMPEEREVPEDATEEIWDQRIAPEFKWDD
jgi:hypothetical protein